MVKAGVIGAAGYAGIECVRILLGHPEFELTYAASNSDAGKRLSEVYPQLGGATDITFEILDVTRIIETCDIVFLAVPHTASMAITPALLQGGVTVIDISADYRIKDAAVYEKWYGVQHTSAPLLASAVYGLPEENVDQLISLRESSTKLVACAGCYPTASALSCLPALHAGWQVSDKVISDCLSGISGSGRKLTKGASFCAAADNVCAYGVASHRHTPEIAQTLSGAAGKEMQVVFTPHLVPMVRGLLSTVYIEVAGNLSLQDMHDFYQDFYAHAPFVTVLPLGHMPQTSDVKGTNNAHLGMGFDENTRMLIVSCAIDNLVKGAAGQAVQCANIVCGFAQDAGLKTMFPPVV